jgi:sulfite reductase (NADPH) flavoprotein alpha-component
MFNSINMIETLQIQRPRHENAPAPQAALPARQPHSRQNPFLAELVGHDRLTGPGSEKDTRHFVLNLRGSGLSYAPGDSLGAFGRNAPELVDELVGMLGFAPEMGVKDPAGNPVTLRETLMRDYTVNRSNRKVVQAVAERAPLGDLRNRAMQLTDNPNQLSDYIGTRDYVDILREFQPVRFETPESFLSLLSPITPRLYSIASSHDAHPGEAHLCVAVVRYDTHGRPKKGLASGFLADHADMFVKSIPVYVQESRGFRLPKDPSRDIIMCGPGAGVAPFRAFLEQRILEGATGRNWLFFGEQHRATDFLYGNEFEDYLRKGKLHRLDAAFSRDQSQKIYVHHRMREAARELWSWLENGAYFYVCGDARHMAKDVHQALLDIAQSEGGLSPEAAADYVNVTLMKTEKRYLRDVY